MPNSTPFVWMSRAKRGTWGDRRSVAAASMVMSSPAGERRGRAPAGPPAFARAKRDPLPGGCGQVKDGLSRTVAVVSALTPATVAMPIRRLEVALIVTLLFVASQ